MENSKNTIITIIVLALLVSGLVYAIVRFGGSSSEAPPEKENNNSEVVSSSGNRITITDQPPGSIVFISSATFAEGGFVVIYTNENGSLGKNIGAKYFRDGTGPGDIELSEPLFLGSEYFAVMHRDNGNRVFDSEVDSAYSQEDGSVISVKFKVVETLPEQKL
ncbi:MAG: hypothetical protein WDZ88_03620 [Candidatus Paceibacterota bacterium]